jgi:hypothetical protein
MAIANRTDTILSAGFTQTQLIAAIKTAFANAGKTTTYDEYTSGTNQILVYEFTYDASKTYGKCYLWIQVTNAFVCSQQLFLAWNTTTKAGSNGSSAVTFTAFLNTAQVRLIALDGGTEYTFVHLSQGTNYAPVGVLFPANKRDDWDVNAYGYGFIANVSTCATWRSISINPYGNTLYDALPIGNSRLANAGSVFNQRDLLAGLILLTQSNQGYACKTSDDIGAACATGSIFLDTITDGTKQYIIFGAGAGIFAVRTS